MVFPPVLVIEDNSGDRELWTIVLGELHQDRAADFAQDGIEALEVIRGRIAAGAPLALIISDHRLPRLNGAELYTILAQELRAHGTSFVMLTGTVTLASMARADCPWYEKPLGYADFKDLVLKLMRRFPSAFTVAAAPNLPGSPPHSARGGESEGSTR